MFHIPYNLCTQVFGRLLHKTELAEFAAITDELSATISPAGPGSELDIYSWLRFVSPASKTSYDRLLNTTAQVSDFFWKETKLNKVNSSKHQ